MNCDDVRSRIDDFVDGDLPAGEESEVSGHLHSCTGCRDEEQALRSLLAAAARLPDSVAPSRDLWQGIARRIGQPSARRFRTQRLVFPWDRTWDWRVAAAAASIVVVAALGFWIASGPGALPGARHPGTPVAVQGGAPSPGASAPGVVDGAVVPAAGSSGIEGAEIAFYEARQQLRAALEERRGALSPKTLRAVSANMKTIEEAIAEIHTALDGDPGNRELQRMLVAAHQREVALLAQVTRTAALRTR